MDIDRRAVLHTARQRGPGLHLGPFNFRIPRCVYRYGGSQQLALQQALYKFGLLTRIQKTVLGRICPHSHGARARA